MESRATITLFDEFNQPGVFDGLEGVSHLWLIFLFHLQNAPWSARVRPPRLGGNTKVGVFSTRSPRRPNPIGLSLVRLVAVDQEKNRLIVSAADLVDGTPILDIKPYLPYADHAPGATHTFADAAPVQLPVTFSDECLELITPEEREFISSVLGLDPRPAYHNDDRAYGTTLGSYNIRWRVSDETVVVFEIEKLGCNSSATPSS